MAVLSLPRPSAEPPARYPKTPPSSYRLEVWTYSESFDSSSGSVTRKRERLVWCEPDGREFTWEVPSRITSALFWLRVKAEINAKSTMLGSQPFEGGAFEALTMWAYPAREAVAS